MRNGVKEKIAVKIPIERFGTINDVLSGDVWSPERLSIETRLRAEYLQTRLAGGDDYVVIAHGGTPSFFADLFATWEAGACAVCLNADSTTHELETIADFIKPSAVLVTADEHSDSSNIAAPLLSLADNKKVSRASVKAYKSPVLDAPALILFTSGTTGNPKGVVHTFRSIFARLALNLAHIESDCLERTLCVLPTHFGHGLIGNCLTPLFAGKDLFLLQNTSLESASMLGGVISDHGITFMSSVPAFWRVALRVGVSPPTDTLRQVNVGSAPLSAALWREISSWSKTDNVVNMYGITETANWVAGASARTLEPEDGLIGTMWGGWAAVESEDGTMQTEGEGEILLQTPSLMRGYHLRPDLSEAVLRAGWFKTGDIGEIRADRSIRITGRRKSEINRAGIKIHPEEIDLLLERHPLIQEACTFGLPDEIGGEIVAVAIHLKDATEPPNSRQLRDWCAQRIKRESIPERWYFLPGIPKSERGKINRDLVMARCLEGPGH